MDAERVAHRVHTLCSTIEALGQELQDAQATIDLMAQTALDREKEIARLREEFADIERITSRHWVAGAWVPMEDDDIELIDDIARVNMEGPDND